MVQVESIVIEMEKAFYEFLSTGYDWGKKQWA